MPELPEVETTVRGLNKMIPESIITDIWSTYHSGPNPLFHKGKSNVKDPNYFKKFKKDVVGRKIEKVERIGKNVLINLASGKTILIHMKMTGHLLYGKYKKQSVEKKEGDGWKKETWLPNETKESPLWDPFNRHIRFVFSLSDGKHLVMSDARRFARIILVDQKNDKIKEVEKLGPDPLENNFTFKKFFERLNKKPNGKIKTVLMDQEKIAGIGNIYSDEMLWHAKIHPEETIKNIPQMKLKKMYSAMKEILKRSIKVGGDSQSDYRNTKGEKGGFQKLHKVYQRKGLKCPRPRCGALIERIVVAGRSSHFCPDCQRRSSR